MSDREEMNRRRATLDEARKFGTSLPRKFLHQTAAFAKAHPLTVAPVERKELAAKIRAARGNSH